MFILLIVFLLLNPIDFSGKERIIVFGGRTQDKLGLEDCYSFDTQTNVWTKVIVIGKV